MTEISFEKISVCVAGGVATVTIDNPPVNVLDLRLMTDLRRFLIGARNDEAIRVISAVTQRVARI